MKLVALLMLLAVSAAWADPLPSDRPLAVDVKSGVLTTGDEPTEYEQFEVEGGRYFNAAGIKQVDEWIAKAQKENVALTARNGFLERRVDEVAAQPGLGFKTALVLSAAGFLAGIMATTLIVIQLRK
jgi:hypothetical protein